MTTEDSNFLYTVAVFATHEVDEVQNALDSKEPNPYESIKAAVIGCIGMPDKQWIGKLFAKTEVGDRQSSQVLQQMRTLAGNSKIDDTSLKDVDPEAAFWHEEGGWCVNSGASGCYRRYHR